MSTSYYILLFTPSILITISLIIHCWYYKGTKITILFFILGFIFFCLRENMVALTVHYEGKPQYFHPNAPFKIFNAPIIAIIGWMITVYLGWTFSEEITSQNDKTRNRIFPIILFAGIFSSAMAFAIEGTAIKLNWWSWAKLDIYYANDPFKEYLQFCPFVALQGWFFTSLTFLAPFLLVFCSDYSKSKYKYLWFLIIPINAYLLTGSRFETFRYPIFFSLLLAAIISDRKIIYSDISSK